MDGIRTGRDKLALILALVCAPLAAQTRLSLQEAGARDAATEYRPRHGGERVLIRGVVNSVAFDFPDYTLLSLDDGDYGAVLRVPGGDHRLRPYRPGDELEVEGIIEAVAGMPVVAPSSIVKTGVKPAPAPLDVPVARLVGFRYLGRLVRARASTLMVGDTA